MINYMSTYSGYYDGEYIWMISNFAPILCKIKTVKWIVEDIYPLPEWAEFTAFKQVCRIEDKLIFFPLEGYDILIYDMNTLKFSSLLNGKNSFSMITTGDVKEDEKNIYVIPKNVESSFLIIDKKSMEIKNYLKWIDCVKDAIGTLEYRTTLSALYHEKLYTPICGTELVVIFDVKNNRVSVKRLELENHLLHCLSESEEGLVISFLDSFHLLLWKEDEECVPILCNDYEICNHVPYYRCIEMEGNMLVLPNKGTEPIKLLDLSTMKLSNFNYYPEMFQVLNEEGTTFYGYYIQEKHVYLLPLRGNSVLDIDIENKTICSQIIRDTKEVNSYFKSLYGENGEQLKSESRKLRNFLLYVVNPDRECKKVKASHNGRRIWEKLSEELKE